MTKEFDSSDKFEIRRAYREAADPSKQISILADLYDCHTSDIVNVIGEDSTSYIKGVNDNITPKRRIKWTSDNIAKLKSYHDSNMPYNKIAEKFGISSAAVNAAIARYVTRGNSVEGSNHSSSYAVSSVNDVNVPIDAGTDNFLIRYIWDMIKNIEYLLCDYESIPYGEGMESANQAGLLMGKMSGIVCSMKSIMNYYLSKERSDNDVN